MASEDMAKKIRELRKERGLTLEQVANVVGVGKSTVRKWETGMIANMKRDKIDALAKALGTTPAYLMGWKVEKINLHLFDGGESEPPLTEGEKQLLEAFRKLTPENQELALQMLLGALERLQ